MTEPVGDRIQPLSIDKQADEEEMDNVDMDEEDPGRDPPSINDDGNQLPSLEEARQSISHKAVMSPAKRNRLICYGCLIFLVFALVITTILLAVDLGKAKQIAEKNSEYAQGASNDEGEIQKFLLENSILKEEDLNQPGSPQKKALAYMHHEIESGQMYSLYSNMELNKQKIIERYVLSVIYYYYDGENWSQSFNFLTPQDNCQWNIFAGVFFGVSFCNQEGHVEGLTLSGNNLQGKGFPDELQHLVVLGYVRMDGNKISGSLNGLEQLSNMRILDLETNRLMGTIPSRFGDLERLELLWLSNNRLDGKVPSTLSKLNNLRFLGLDDNKLNGNLDELLQDFVYLTFLYLEDNEFTGSVDWLTNLQLLRFVDVSNNKLGGALPNSLFSHENLEVLDLHGNLLSGNLPIPSDISANTALRLVSLHSNSLKGPIPDSIASLGNATMLDLSFNQLTGTIPDLSSMKNLIALMTSGNDFSEQSMPDLSALTNLAEISMKGNNVIGTIPQWIGDLKELFWLDLDANEFTGSIPSEIGQLEKLVALLLNRNDLDSTIPTEIANLGTLNWFFLDGNSITGDTNAMCNATHFPNYFVSDCKDGPNGEPAQLACPCCSFCCANGDADCWDLDFAAKNDPMWENHNVYWTNFRRDYGWSEEDASEQFSKEFDETN